MNIVDQKNDAKSSEHMITSNCGIDVVKTFHFSLKNGEEVDLEVSSKLLQDVAKTFEISTDDVSDNHIKYYLASSMKKALELHEESC